MTNRKLKALLSFYLLWPLCQSAFGQEETPKNVIAVQIRKQGFPCDNPISAEKDPQESRADSPVWFLDCENQRYRVRLNPGMAAAVEKIN